MIHPCNPYQVKLLGDIVASNEGLIGGGCEY